MYLAFTLEEPMEDFFWYGWIVWYNHTFLLFVICSGAHRCISACVPQKIEGDISPPNLLDMLLQDIFGMYIYSKMKHQSC